MQCYANRAYVDLYPDLCGDGLYPISLATLGNNLTEMNNAKQNIIEQSLEH